MEPEAGPDESAASDPSPNTGNRDIDIMDISTNTTNSRFERLPQELRDNIYSFLPITTDYEISLGHGQEAFDVFDTLDIYLALAGTSRTTRNDVIKIFWPGNKFKLYGGAFLEDSTATIPPHLTPIACKLLTNLKIRCAPYHKDHIHSPIHINLDIYLEKNKDDTVSVEARLEQLEVKFGWWRPRGYPDDLTEVRKMSSFRQADVRILAFANHSEKGVFRKVAGRAEFALEAAEKGLEGKNAMDLKLVRDVLRLVR